LTHLHNKGIIRPRLNQKQREILMDIPITTAGEGLQPKTHLSGKVVKIAIAGAIVDIGQKVPGVIHISQLSKDAVNRVEDKIQVGQTVDVWIRKIHDDRIELTMIQPLALDWKEIQADLVVKGKVARLEPYGAFIDIGAERPGLVHVSEISHSYVKNPSDVLKEGEEIEAKVLEVDRRKKQIRLSIKAVLPKPEEVIKETTKADATKNRGRNRKKVDEPVEEPETSAPELTSFQMAFQKAQDNSATKNGKNRKTKSGATDEQEELLHRTLKTRITTG
jgi:small subunit ribosomal protein S1